MWPSHVTLIQNIVFKWQNGEKEIIRRNENISTQSVVKCCPLLVKAVITKTHHGSVFFLFMIGVHFKINFVVVRELTENIFSILFPKMLLRR